MRELPNDIIEQMRIQFESEYENSKEILTEYLTENKELNSDRIIRCIVFLSQNGIDSLKSNLNLSKTDWRDIIIWAEYDYSNKNKPKRIRDFNKTFSENNL